MSTKKFVVSFMLEVPECNGMGPEAISCKDIEGEIQSWFEDLWCQVYNCHATEYDTEKLT